VTLTEDLTNGLGWLMTNIRNPPSLKASDSFTNIKVVSKTGYLVTELTQDEVAIVTNG
jgi:hypothetical protein